MSAPEQVNVLLIDDDEIDVMAVKRAFRAHGMTTPLILARDGLEALSLLRGARVPRPFLILLDLNMPRVDGLEFLRELRADPRHRSALVFVITTSAAEQDRAAAYSLNVAGYILKSDCGDDCGRVIALLHAYCGIVTFP